MLNRTLQQWSEKRGRDWSQDIHPFMCRPNPVYVNAESTAEMAPYYQDLRDRTGVSILGFD